MVAASLRRRIARCVSTGGWGETTAARINGRGAILSFFSAAFRCDRETRGEGAARKTGTAHERALSFGGRVIPPHEVARAVARGMRA